MFQNDTNQSALEERWKKEISCIKEKQEIPEKFHREEGKTQGLYRYLWAYFFVQGNNLVLLDNQNSV